ncbi:LOW QUALITY PROTEIN: uncharacterized protein LOC128387898 [Panonychus citri]|uniref:LOW QUALITY PROTEIN: uncharacterized protein LOC128387898 n=1 Tax=Panonychus citri TaxID=50023 RepID=UPI002307E5CF|nr:LOW QUALITY PROTEIN: uncharacterized protein LOC128387898 [Panonychus citri]
MEDQLISLDENMKLTIVNREKSYEISKQKLSSIPYFVKLFADSDCDTTKIELDLDESSFDNIIEFILDGQLSISIESASSMVETCDYLGMDEIKRKYYDCFESNFRIKHLEEFLDFLRIINVLERLKTKLKSFIGKYFVPISNTRAFQKFPVTLLERLLKMHLGVSSELQIFAAIVRWCKFDKKARKKYLPQLMKFVNFRRMKDPEITTCVSMFEDVGISSNFRHGKKPRAYLPEFCRFDCIIKRQYNKSLISIYELDEDKINIRRLSRSNLWIKYGQFTRDETMSTSLIEADHIVDIIYDSGRKGIRIDLIGKKFKYLKMFGGDNSYYGQAYKYFVSDICVIYTYTKIKEPKTHHRKYDSNDFNLKRLEAISLDDQLVGICFGNADPDDSDGFSRSHGFDESDDGGELNESHDQYFYSSSLDYRQLLSYEIKGPVQTRSCFLSKSNKYSGTQKVFYFLTKRKFCKKVLRFKDVLDYSFLKEFIGSDSLDHIELISHENTVLICNKETKMIYSYNDDIDTDIDYDNTDYWQFMSKIESPEKMITIASICLPFDCEQ